MALVAPAGPVEPGRVEASAERCRSLGFEPVVFPHASARAAYLAGTDDERLADLQSAFDDPTIDAVWALRGGYGTMRILDRLSLDRQRRDPILFLGFSDNTALHARHAELGVVSIHGPHPAPIPPPEADAWMWRLAGRAEPAGTLPRDGSGAEPRQLSPGVGEGPLLGGNLAILASLCGTRHAVTGRGAILFLEDVGEPAYRVDRMLLQLERSGALEGITGLAFGRFTDAEGADAEVAEVLAEYAARSSAPAVAGLPFGHVPGNFAVPVGVSARLDADAAELTILEAAVRAG